MKAISSENYSFPAQRTVVALPYPDPDAIQMEHMLAMQFCYLERSVIVLEAQGTYCLL